MPNSAYVPGNPVANVLQGFDRPADVHFIIGRDKKPIFFGYLYQCNEYVEKQKLRHGFYDIIPAECLNFTSVY